MNKKLFKADEWSTTVNNNNNHNNKKHEKDVNMYKLLGGLKDYFKAQEIQTDNAVFRLHNVFTTVLLLTSSLIITATQYVGQPISCIVNGLPTHVVNTFCWVSSTFTMPDAFNRQVNTYIYVWICRLILTIK